MNASRLSPIGVKMLLRSTISQAPMIGYVHYLNSGGWVESMTGIVEHRDGRMEILGYEDVAGQFPRPPPLALVEELEEPEAALGLA